MSHNQFDLIRDHKDMGEINSLYQIMLLKGLIILVWVEKILTYPILTPDDSVRVGAKPIFS